MNIASNSKEADSSPPSKQDQGNTINNDTKVSNKGPSSSCSSPWLRLKDPRIVRVSRAFGGKDRHSKVCTIRGLRDRRVRLSVPTAIQLYDLQDRLGLNQPSKVVDWLLNAAKHEIDELPPLPIPIPIPIPPSNFSLNHNQMVLSSTNSQQEAASSTAGGASSQSNKDQLGLNTTWEDPASRSISFWSSADSFWRAKSKEQIMEHKRNGIQEEKPVEISHHGANHSSSLPSALLNNAVQLPFGSYYHFDPSSNFALPQLGSHHGFGASQSHNTTEDVHNFNVVAAPLSLTSGAASQILLCPPPAAGGTQPLFPHHANATEIDPGRQQVNHHFQNLLPNSLNPTTAAYSISQSMIRPNFHLSMSTSRLPNSNNSSTGNHQPDHKEQEFRSYEKRQ